MTPFILLATCVIDDVHHLFTDVAVGDQLMNSSQTPTAVVTGASYGLGAVYADRLAPQGNDLVLVARSREDLDRVAAGIREQTGQRVDVIVADLGAVDQLATVERRILEDDSISILVNN